jgi:replicative DNA helicase
MSDERLPPNDRDAERSVLGAVYRFNELLGDALQVVQADDFYSHAHRRIFAAIVSLVETGKPADPVSLCDYFTSRKELADIGGVGYLVELWDASPAPNVAYHAKLVRRCARIRSLIHAAGELQADAYEPGADADELIARAEETIFRLSAVRTESRLVNWRKMVADAQTRIDRRSNRADGEVDEGLKTVWTRFNKVTGGIYKGELTVIAARPSVGKTLSALCIINAVCGEGHRVFFASLEQSYMDIADRMLAQVSGVNSHKFRVGMAPEDAERVMEAAAKTDHWKLHTDDSPEQTVSQIASHARRLKAREGLDMVVVDYLGLIKSTRARGMNRAEEVGILTHQLRALAKSLQVSVVLLAQLNRGVDNRPNQKPRLSDLRESGDIEQDADTVLLLHKSQDPDGERTHDNLDVIIAKQRNGPCETIEMLHEKATFRVYELN